MRTFLLLVIAALMAPSLSASEMTASVYVVASHPLTGERVYSSFDAAETGIIREVTAAIAACPMDFQLCTQLANVPPSLGVGISIPAEDPEISEYRIEYRYLGASGIERTWVQYATRVPEFTIVRLWNGRISNLSVVITPLKPGPPVAVKLEENEESKDR